MVTKDKVISAAIEEFAEHGYRSATIRGICKRAGVNIAAINYHFAGKTELYRQALAMLFAFKKPLPSADKIKSDSDLRKVLKEWISAFLYRGNDPKILENRLMEKVAYHEMLDPSEIFNEIFESYLKPDAVSLEKILYKGLPPDVAEKEVKMRAFAVLGNCMFYFFHYRVVEKISAQTDFLESNMEMIVNHITGQSMLGLKFS
jgi:AcrR family transcriptional regulator